MSYGIKISSAIGSDDITDLSSFRILAVEVKTESVTTASQVFTYTAPTGWSSSNGTFYVIPNSTKVMPSFYVSSGNSISASFGGFNSIYKADSWRIFWLVKTGTDTTSGYGFLVSNGSGQTVLSDATETLLVKESGVLSSYSTTNTGLNQFSLPSGFLKEDDTLFVKVPDGSDLFASARNFYTDADNLRANSSTETSLDYFVVSKSFSLSSPTSGYGLAVFNAGSMIYSSDYDIFPSNGQTLRVQQSGSSATIDNSKDVWVCLNFGTPAPFCPDGGLGAFPTFNYLMGVERSGVTLSPKVFSLFNDTPSAAQSSPHDNTALIVQR